MNDSYVLPKSKFLPLPRQNYSYMELGHVFRVTDMLACSSPSPQHDQGDVLSRLVIGSVLSSPFLKSLPGQQGWCAMASCTFG